MNAALIVVAMLLCFVSHGQNRRALEGFSYSRDDIAEGPWSVQVIKLDRSKTALRLHTTLGTNTSLGLAPLSEQMKTFPRSLGRPIAAVNGDYYRDEGPYAGDPKGFQIVNGELVSAPCDWTALWIDSSGQPRMTNVSSRFEATFPDGTRLPFGLNEERARGAAVLYTSAVGATTKTKGGREFILERHATNTWLLLRVGEEYLARVKEARSDGNSPIAPGCMVLSLDSEVKTPVLKAGDTVRLMTATIPFMTNVITAIGGGPALVRDGKAVPRGELVVRNPRTALGWSKDFFYIIQVDGRRLNVSVGMTTAELTAYLLKLGCDQAMSLDGGGSSTCWVYGQVMNNPSEGFERSMANALVVVRPPAAP